MDDPNASGTGSGHVELDTKRMPATYRVLRPSLAAAALCLSTGALSAFEADQILVHNIGDFVIKPQLEQSTQYSDNIFFGNDTLFQPGTTVPLRPQEDDLILTVTPGVLFQYGRDSGNLISLKYSLDEIFYAGHSDFDTQQHHIDSRSKVEFGKFKLTGVDSVHFLSSFMGGGFFTDPNNPDRSRLQVDRRQTTVDHKLLFDYSDKTDVYGEFLFTETDFDKTTSLFDINNLRGTLGATYKYSEKLAFFTEGFYGQSAINPNAAGSKGPHSDVYGGFAGVRGEFTPKLSGSLKVGYEQRSFPGLTLAADSPAIEISGTYAAGPLTGIVLTYSRRTSTSVQFAQQTYIYDAIGLTVNQGLGTSGTWMISGSARYDRGEFDPLSFPTRINVINPDTGTVTPVPAAVVYAPRSDDNLTFSGGVVYRPRPWCSITLAYEFEHFKSDAVYSIQRVSTGETLLPATKYLVDYDAHRVLLKFSFGY